MNRLTTVEMVESVAAAAFSSDGESTVIRDALFYAAFWLKLKAS